MGDLRVRLAKTETDLNTFTKHLLTDVQALNRMLIDGWFETDEIHIGAEQEMCLVDAHGKPSPTNLQILEKLNNPSFTTELARFNIEANLDPLPFRGNCLSQMEENICRMVDDLRRSAREIDVYPILTGILPTIRKSDITIENLTPVPRYFSLIEAINTLRGEYYEVRLEGQDELNVKVDSALIEACNTSFQVHLQIKPEEFVSKYNIAQAIAAPVLALGTNSPLLFGKRLWNETRIALFRQSIDTRFASEHLRERSPRVTFGSKWLSGSITDLYKEDIVRFSVMFMSDIDEDVFDNISKGITPRLRALNIHNSTVYRWNRPCYGISPNGKPHLRIENRVLPAGPTVVDEVANSAFWFGLMNGLETEYKDITKVMDFDDAKSNFFIAARAGLGAKYVWTNGKKINDTELIRKELIPLAIEGLKRANIDKADIDKYMKIIEERNESGNTGSRWILNSHSSLIKQTTRDEVNIAITSAIMSNQEKNIPVNEWELASIQDIADYSLDSLLVEEFMTTDLFTVKKSDIPELSADIMDWHKIRYIPVENDKSELIGLISSRTLLRYFVQKYRNTHRKEQNIEELMIHNPFTISPQASVSEAMKIMIDNKIGCLPVINKGHLVGIITESNFLNITSSLLKHLQKRKESKKRK